MALAFVPMVSLGPAFIALSLDPVVARIPGIAPLLVYYEQTWFNSDFPIQMCNVFSQSTRTNNRVEGWHHKLNRAIGHSHPNTHDLISVLNKEQTTTEETLQRARLGAPPPPRRWRYEVYRSRFKLKTAQLEKRVFVNEDFTARRAGLARQTRALKKVHEVNDYWTAGGNVMIKDLQNRIRLVKSTADLALF